MKRNSYTLAIPELKMKFSTRISVQKDELRKFYHLLNPALTEQAFRRILYSLEKERCITPIGAGLYALAYSTHASTKKKFIPRISPTAQELGLNVNQNFPYTQYLIWETGSLYEFMTHQPGRKQIVLEIEKDSAESVFNKLKEQPSRNIFLEPDRLTFERYIIDSPESILLLQLVTQSPKIKTNGIVSARLEKILVDIFSDEDRFYIFQGQEMVNIFENAFSTYWINTKTLFRYASRRKVNEKLKNFINTRTQINRSTT